MTFKEIICKLNVVRAAVAIALDHKRNHAARLAVGGVLMAIGISTYKSAEWFALGHGIAAFGLDALGFLIHGIGITPYIELLAAVVEEE